MSMDKSNIKKVSEKVDEVIGCAKACGEQALASGDLDNLEKLDLCIIRCAINDDELNGGLSLFDQADNDMHTGGHALQNSWSAKWS